METVKIELDVTEFKEQLDDIRATVSNLQAQIYQLESDKNKLNVEIDKLTEILSKQ